MPLTKPLRTLVDRCLDVVYQHIIDYCAWLNGPITIPNKTDRVLKMREFLTQNIPTTLLDILLKMHSKIEGKNPKNSLQGYYFFKLVLHNHAESFQAKNYDLPLSYWYCLFDIPFVKMRRMNLSLSCCDNLLELIPNRFPNLEFLNATCKLQRFDFKGNAPYFASAVTDNGLGHLENCEKLRSLLTNEARSHVRKRVACITHTGFRKLLRERSTLEDLSYSDIGSVLAKDMDDVSQLSLKKVRHYNATVESLMEIFRLCPRLETLILIFLDCLKRCTIVDELIRYSATHQLRVLEIHNLYTISKAHELYEGFGSNLVDLTVINTFKVLRFEQLLVIARSCPNLEHFSLARMSNSKDTETRVANFGQFSELRSLNIVGENMNAKNLLTFCTENAEYLEVLKFSERLVAFDADNLFLNCIHPQRIRHIETTSNLIFSKSGIRRIMDKYPCLEFLNANCPEDCSDLMTEIDESRLMFTFMNTDLSGFRDMHMH